MATSMATPWDVGRVFATLSPEDRKLAKFYIDTIELFDKASPESRLRVLRDLEVRHTVRTPIMDKPSD